MAENMTVKEVAEEFVIPQKAIRWLIETKIVSRDLTQHDDQVVLDFLSKIWRNDTFAKMLLASRSIKKRQTMVQCAGMNKLETYAYSRFKNRTEAISVKCVGQEIHRHFGVAPDHKILSMIRRIRKKVENQRQYHRKKAMFESL